MTRLQDAAAFSPYIRPSLTDLYQITMTYALWKAGLHERKAVYEYFFRTCPFGGEYALFGGVQDVMQLIQNFSLTNEEIIYLSEQLPHIEREFWQYLQTGLRMDLVSVFGVPEGTLVFPRIPLLQIYAPQIIGQLLETPILNTCNFATLVLTNAARIREATGPDKGLLEGGLRRAQGPDGALTASRYSYMGGFTASSNVLAGKLYDVPIGGTFAHAFVSSFKNFGQIPRNGCLVDTKGADRNFFERVLMYRDKLVRLFPFADPNDGELAAFTTYAICYPDKFLALVDTYDTLKSGVINFLAVAMALHELGYKAKGIRLDSGDLAYLSREARKMFVTTVAKAREIDYFKHLTIVASNDINEDTLRSMNEQGHEINTFLVGTNLVTCQKQPALGGVYKLVSVEDEDGVQEPVIKLSQNIVKVTLPGAKDAYRLYLQDGTMIADLICCAGEHPPKVGQPVLCRHPFEEGKRVRVIPSKVERLNGSLWGPAGYMEFPTIHELREHVMSQMALLREDHKRPLNPTPYKVSVSQAMYDLLHNQWQENQPIETLR